MALPSLTLIASVARNRVIGNDGKQPLYLKADLKRFSQLTTGHPVIMGRKTYESIFRKLGKPLPNRTNFIVTRQRDFLAPGCIVCHSIEVALSKARESGSRIFVIGGGQLFEQAFPLADSLELTEIDADLEGNVLFPVIPSSDWKEVSREQRDENGVKYAFVSYVRK